MTQVISAVRPRAVQYLRMSTENQSYSIENQVIAIAGYAEAQGYDVVGTYTDYGKSGLTLKERTELGRLLHDVRQSSRDFSIVLVLDVTRWGRFQDPDQSAAYEFFCREAGVKVEYAVEAFANDGSVSTAIVKQLKRIMAAEYSRELSDKVSRAKRIQAQAGFWQGGCQTYCVRRLLVDATGNERGYLASGEQKFLQNDKVLFRPGPDEEVAVVRRVFQLYVNKGVSLAGIATLLNADKIPGPQGKTWLPRRVRAILRSELMIGLYRFGHTKARLKAAPQLNPESEWIRAKVFEPIVSPKLFALASKRLDADLCNFVPDNVLLNGLRRLLRESGKLDWTLINACKYLPSGSVISGRFGGMKRAFALIGYSPECRGGKGRPKWNLSNEELLEALRRLHTEHGRLSTKLIIADKQIPSPSHFVRKFGSLLNAYGLAGLPFTRKQQRSSGGKARWCRNQTKFPWAAAS